MNLTVLISRHCNIPFSIYSNSNYFQHDSNIRSNNKSKKQKQKLLAYMQTSTLKLKSKSFVVEYHLAMQNRAKP